MYACIYVCIYIYMYVCVCVCSLENAFLPSLHSSTVGNACDGESDGEEARLLNPKP